jgi:prevent-host-death family protein
MATSVPTETTMKLTDTKQHLSQVINRVARGETRVIVEKSGLPVAAIISAEEYQRFKIADAEIRAHRERLDAIFTRFSQAFADVPDDELERQVDRAVQEVRAEKRADQDAALSA